MQTMIYWMLALEALSLAGLLAVRFKHKRKIKRKKRAAYYRRTLNH